MGKHDRDAADHRTLRLVAHPDADLEVRRTGVRDLEVVHDVGAPAPPAETDGTTALDETEEPEEYGLRVAWQSEAVKIEAAEFLIATRIQQDARIRDSHVLSRLRSRGRH